MIPATLALRFITSMTVGNNNLFYKLLSISTFLISQIWMYLHIPELLYIWIPWAIILLLPLCIKKGKTGIVIQTLFGTNCIFFTELIAILQLFVCLYIR